MEFSQCLDDDGAEDERHTPPANQYLLTNGVSVATADDMPTLLLRVTGQHQQADSLQQDGLYLAPLDGRYLYDALRPERDRVALPRLGIHGRQ